MWSTGTFPWLSQPDSDIYFGNDTLAAGLNIYPHSHAWGQFNCVSEGFMYFTIGEKVFVTPPTYGIWIPPNVEHSAHNDLVATFRPIHFSAKLAGQLPAHPCALEISPVMRAIIDDLARRQICVPESAQDKRLSEVVVDQLRSAAVQENYLPFATSKELTTILDLMQQDPADDRSLANWAALVNSTVRTLERRCLAELGMTLSEWRQRLRFLRAVDGLVSGKTIQQIAFELGYSTPSAFVSMFRRMSGTTPGRFQTDKRIQSAQ